MKAKHAVLLFAVGYCLEFFGAMAKITRAPYANSLLLVAVILKVAAALLFAFKIIRYNGFKNFMNS
jgi:hypothetical protein